MFKESDNQAAFRKQHVYTLLLFLVGIFSGCVSAVETPGNSDSNVFVQAMPGQTLTNTLPVTNDEETLSSFGQSPAPTDMLVETPSPMASTDKITSTISSSPAPLSTNVPANIEPTVTPEVLKSILFRLAYGQSYDLIDFSGHGELADPQQIHRPGRWIDSEGEESGPADALALSFAHYQNKVAYWTQDQTGHLWLSDLELTSPRLIYSDEINTYFMQNYGNGDLELIWTPDDLHLILDAKDESRVDSIYHLETDTIEPWPWQCNLVAISPKTSRLATWCESTSSSEGFTVIEWGGEIWHSESLPEMELLRLDRALQTHWAWSSDGERIAFFDPQDDEGRLVIADSQGYLSKLFPGAAWWSSEDVKRSKISVPKQLLQWSQDGNTLLIYAHGQTESSCPLWANLAAPDSEMLYKVPCWQVIDRENNTILWTLDTSINDEEMAKYWQFNQASLSPNGNLLSLSAWSPGFSWTGIVDLSDGSTNWWDTPVSVMRWANSLGQ